MNTAEITLLIFFLVIAAVLLRWAHLYGVEKKEHYKNEAVARLNKDLQGVNIQKDGYEIFRYIIFWGKDHGWGKVSYEEMKQDIIENCIKYTGSGADRYAPAEYSICINKESKVIYCMVGDNNYDFSEIQELIAHNKSFKLPAKNQQAGTREELRAP